MNSYWLLLLPVAATFGYFSAAKNKRHTKSKRRGFPFARYSFEQFNGLLENQPDKAVDLFIKNLEVDQDTVETHLALGYWFRRRGQVDRAIRIHQNLVAQQKLNYNERSDAVYALAKDYFTAGVLDRAESLFKELVEHGAYLTESYQALIYIYEQEKEWQQAIDIAQKLSSHGVKTVSVSIAQYYCELAEQSLRHSNINDSSQKFKQALSINSKCARAHLGLAKLAIMDQNYRLAVRHLKSIRRHASVWLFLTVDLFQKAYTGLNRTDLLIDCLKDLLNHVPFMPIAVRISELIEQHYGCEEAAVFLKAHIERFPTLQGVHDLVSFRLRKSSSSDDQDLLELLERVTRILARDSMNYLCTNCGFSGAIIHWQCPSCKQWETVKPHQSALQI